MGHVNNAAYLDYLEEALFAAGPAGAASPAGSRAGIRLEYLAPASPGATLTGAAWAVAASPGSGPGWAWRLEDGAGRELARGGVTADDGRGDGLRPASPRPSRPPLGPHPVPARDEWAMTRADPCGAPRNRWAVATGGMGP